MCRHYNDVRTGPISTDREGYRALASWTLLRWRPAEGPWHSVFVEAGVGIRRLSDSTLSGASGYEVKEPNDGLTYWGVTIRLALESLRADGALQTPGT